MRDVRATYAHTATLPHTPQRACSVCEQKWRIWSVTIFGKRELLLLETHVGAVTDEESSAPLPTPQHQHRRRTNSEAHNKRAR